MKEFFSGFKFKILLIILMLFIGIMLSVASSGGFASLPSNLLGSVLAPVQKLSSSISKGVGDFIGSFVRAEAINKENQQLKEEIRKLTSSLIEYEQIKKENAQFKKYLGLKDQNPHFVFESAQVIGRDIVKGDSVFVIDKGSLAGVLPKNPVITSDGLVGIVKEVGARYSIVVSILDSSIDVGAISIRTNDTGMVGGNPSLAKANLCTMTLLPRDSGITKGDLIVTSGVGGIYPKGLLIGTVEEVKSEVNGVSIYATIKPAADIKNTKEVFIIKNFDGRDPGLDNK